MPNLPPAQRGRVMTDDLRPPEELQSSALAGDHFQGFAQPVVDENTKELAKSLQYFSKELSQYGHQQQATHDKEEKVRRLGEWNNYLAKVTPDEALQDIEAGRVPYYHDPYIKSAVRAHYGQNMARALGATIDKEYQDGSQPYGEEGFNPQAMLLDKAAPFLARLNGNPEAITAFNRELQTLRMGVGKIHETKRAEMFNSSRENQFTDNLSTFFDGVSEEINQGRMSFEDGASTIGEVFKDFGPRRFGGTFNMDPTRQNQLWVEVLQRKARDASKAGVANALMRTARPSIDGSGQMIPPISQIEKFKDAVDGIDKQVVATMAAQEKAQYEGNLVRENASNLIKGQAWKIQDRRDHGQWGGEYVQDRSRQMEDAERLLREALRPNGKIEDLNQELHIYVTNGLKHKVFFQEVEGLASSAMTTAGNPSASADASRAVDLYDEALNVNATWATQHMDEKARKFLDGIILREYAGQDRGKAIDNARRDEANRTPLDKEQINHFRTKVLDAAKAINARGDSFWYLFGKQTGNPYVWQQKVTDLATVLYQDSNGAVDPETAITMARDRISKSTGFVNGNAVPGITKDEVPAVEKILTTVWNKNKTWFMQHPEGAINSPKDLSLVHMGKDSWQVVNKNTGALVDAPLFHPEDPDHAVDFIRPRFTWQDIMRVKGGDAATRVHDRLGKGLKTLHDNMHPRKDTGLDSLSIGVP